MEALGPRKGEEIMDVRGEDSNVQEKYERVKNKNGQTLGGARG